MNRLDKFEEILESYEKRAPRWKNMPKTMVFYRKVDPNKKGNTFIAINIDSPRPYVWSAYPYMRKTDIGAQLMNRKDLLVLPAKQTKRLFDFVGFHPAPGKWDFLSTKPEIEPPKTKIVYLNHDPTLENVTDIAVQTETLPPYVWAAYQNQTGIDNLPDDLLVMPIEKARKMFEFEKVDNLSEAVMSYE